MKKALLFLAVLCVAGFFSVKAQSASDSAYARDLSYTLVNYANLPYSDIDSLGNGGKILKDVRLGKRAKGYTINVPDTAFISIKMLVNWDSYLCLLDSNFSVVSQNDYWAEGYSYGSRIILSLVPGQYHILATEYSYDSSNRPYTLIIEEIALSTLNSLTYLPISIPDTVIDTLHSSTANIYYNWDLYKAKGYSFSGTFGDLLTIRDEHWNAYYLLMDSNRTVIANAWHISNLLNYTGTYYLAVLAHENYFCTTFLNTVHTDTNVVLYVDGVNGDDSQDGLSPATALATLDTALERSNGVGTYYLTEDYTFANYAPLYFYYAKVYPYQKDIHLKIGTSCQNDVALIPGKLIFGERGSNYYFLLDSNRADNYYDFLDADYGGSYLEVNNLKVRNTYFPSLVFWGDQVVLRNCEFINDSVEYSLFGLETKNGNSIKFINCTISNSYFMDGLNYIEYDSASITFENTIVSDNVFGWGFYCVRGGIVNLTSGNWRNNNLLDNFYYSDNPNLSTQNCAGIWIYRCNVYMGADFSIDTNNYICIDSLSTINITDNFTAPMVAQIYPMKWDDSYGKYLSDYYEGRPLLSGSASLLRANYQKYGVAQTDTIAIWYLHSDGKIYTTEEPVGIAQAENSDIRIYPNPAADKVTIDLQNTAATEICVMDIYGKTVVRKAVNDQSEVLDLSNLAKGMYFVQIRNNSKVEATQKLIKK